MLIGPQFIVVMTNFRWRATTLGVVWYASGLDVYWFHHGAYLSDLYAALMEVTVEPRPIFAR